MAKAVYLFVIQPRRKWKLPFVLGSLQIALCLTTLVCAQETKDLYTDEDHIVNLNKSNMNSKFLGKQNIFMLEFYNSWCGYCIGFAPTWKAFAQDVKGWNTVAQVAAINCAQDENVEVCRNYKVEKYPSIKNFWTNTQASDLGESANHSYIIAEMRHVLLDYIHAHQKTGVPANWPKLEPVNVVTIQDLWKSVPSSRDILILIVEDDKSYVGREVILDLSSSDITILRILNTNENLMNELRKNVDLPSFPAMFLLNRKGGLNILSSSSITSRENFRNIIEVKILHKEPTEATVAPLPPTTPTPETEKNEIIENVVDMADLENTLNFILKKEVVLKETIEGERLDALKRFVRILNYYFPGRQPVKNFLRDLYVQLTVKKSRKLLATEFTNLLASLETKESFLPPMTNWVGCKGSDPKYRGYPCGLWTLFHVLTSEAYRQHLEIKNGDIKLPEGILIPIKDYVMNFFSCSECVKNFAKESATLENDALFPNDTVLWFWWMHNVVNKRLAGDKSEDPKYPKLQYPSISECPRCHLKGSTKENPMWDEPVVLSFLLSHYTNIKSSEASKLNSMEQFTPDSLGVLLFQPATNMFFCDFFQKREIFSSFLKLFPTFCSLF